MEKTKLERIIGLIREQMAGAPTMHVGNTGSSGLLYPTDLG